MFLFYFDADEACPHCSKYGVWYNTTIYHSLHGQVFEDAFVTAIQDWYALMRGLKAYHNIHKNYSESVSSDSGILLP